jgi:uncharacterized membrane protein YdcZ (DUF606 family)
VFYFLTVFSGILVSISVVFNGMLAGEHSLHLSTVIIHTAGIILISAIILLSRERPFANRQKWFLYLGGAIGVLIIILILNVSFAFVLF